MRSSEIGSWRRFGRKIPTLSPRYSIVSKAKSKTGSNWAAKMVSRSGLNASILNNSLTRNSPSMKDSSGKQRPHDLTKDEIEIEWASRRLLAFTERTFRQYRAGWFHKAVAVAVDQFLADVANK